MSDSTITKRALAGSLRALLDERSFEKISVGDICGGCGMSRKSFYYHFHDKYELVEWIYKTDFVEVMRSEGWSEVNWELAERLCAYFEKNRDFYRKTLAYEGQNCFFDFFRSFVVELIKRDVEQSLPFLAEDPALAEFVVGFYTDAFTTSIKRWILERDDLSAERYLEMVLASLYRVPAESPRRLSPQAAFGNVAAKRAARPSL